MHRQIAGRLTGRVTKWLVLAFWILVAVGVRRLRLEAHRRPEQRGLLVAAGQRGVDPGARQARRRSRTPTRSRPSSSTSVRAGSPRPTSPTANADVAEFADLRRCRGRGARPAAVRGRRGDADAGHLQLRRQRLDGDARRRRGAARDRAESDGVNVLHQRAPAVRPPTPPRCSRASTGTLLFATLGVVILILLFTYRSPMLWMLPIFCAGVALHCLPGADLLPGEVRRPHRQRPEPGDPHDPGHRRRHRLCAAAGGALPRGAPPSRGPARGDGVRPAPGGAGDPGQRGHRRRGHAVPDCSPR